MYTWKGSALAGVWRLLQKALEGHARLGYEQSFMERPIVDTVIVFNHILTFAAHDSTFINNTSSYHIV